MSNQSEVARLMQQIELESRAMEQGLSGLSSSARHTIIDHRYAAIGQCYDQLAGLVSEEQAANILCDAYYRGQSDNGKGGAAQC